MWTHKPRAELSRRVTRSSAVESSRRRFSSTVSACSSIVSRMLLSNAAYSLTKSDVVTGCCRSRQSRAALQAILGLHGTRRQAKRGGGPHERDSAQPDAEAGSREAGQPANGPGQTRPGSGGPSGELLYRPRLTLRPVRGVSPHAHLSDESFPTTSDMPSTLSCHTGFCECRWRRWNGRTKDCVDSTG